MFNNFLFENRAVCEIMWKNIVQPDRPQVAKWRMRIAYWIHKAANTLGMCNTYCFSTATMVARERLSAALCVHTSLVLLWVTEATYKTAISGE